MRAYAYSCDICIYFFIDRNMRKTALRQSDSSSPETGYRRGETGPNMRQKRGESLKKSHIKPAVSLTNQTIRTIRPSEPAAGQQALRIHGHL